MRQARKLVALPFAFLSTSCVSLAQSPGPPDAAGPQNLIKDKTFVQVDCFNLPLAR